MCDCQSGTVSWRIQKRMRSQSEVGQVVYRFVRKPSFDDRAAETYGYLRTDLEKQGKLIGPYDLFIASISLANGATLITHNTTEFSRVSGLIIEDWQ
jgi:predicted nucleic acid-binding protein